MKRRIQAFALLAWLAQMPVTLNARAFPQPKRVLTLYWYGKDFPTNVQFDRGVQNVFNAAGIEYYAEYYEPNRFPGESQETALRDYLKQKYSEKKIDVVIAMSVVSADFLLRYRNDLFPDVPIVFYTTNRNQLDERAGASDGGIVPDNVQALTLNAALRFHPDTRQVFVINGTIDRSNKVETILREQLKVLEGRVAISYLTNLPLNDLLARVRTLPERSLIFYSRQDYDEPGRTLSLTDVLILVANAAKVPIYSSGNYIGYGTVGGYIVNGYESGIQAAGIALRLLHGEGPESLPTINVSGTATFDWRQLRRWGISEAGLPPDSTILFKERTVFEAYKWEIIAALTLSTLQTLLIFGLLAEKKRRRTTQAKLVDRLEFETLLSELSGEFTRLPAKDVDNAIDKWLGRLAEFLGAKSANLVKVSPEGEADQPHALEESGLAIPIEVDGSRWALTLKGPQSGRAWTKDLPPRVCIAGEILAGALVRKANVEALRESQERYKLATTSGGIVVWDWDLATSEIFSDPFIKSVLGYEDQDIRNRFDDWMRLVHPDDFDSVMKKIEAHLQGGTERFESEHRILQKDGGIRWFLVSGSVVRDERGRPIRMVGTGADITRRKLAEQELQLLSARLLDVQDQERRRIARELHDGTAQNLWAIALNLEGLESRLPMSFRPTFLECRTLCTQSLQEIRTLSYLLHPPMLDQAGLVVSLRWYLSGFTKRTGVYVELIAQQDIGRLPAKIEMDLFRIVQECLANVHRHSGSITAQVELRQEKNRVVLCVEDQGHGMLGLTASEKSLDSRTSGVGLSGMAQRLRHLGGNLEIESTCEGTTITAVVPLEEQAAPEKTMYAVTS